MKRAYINLLIGLVSAAVLTLSSLVNVYALGSSQTPQSGALGLEATIPSTPPSVAPTLATPTNGQSFSSIPVTASGLCTTNLVVKVFDNNIFVGSAVCSGGSYSLKIDLFSGTNSIYAQDFDALNQGSPKSNIVSVSYSSSSYTQAGAQVTLTSPYGELGANPGQQLSWPIIIGGGTPPYAISVDWGDGTSSTLKSSSFAGTINLTHTYSSSGVYKVSVTATDNNGVTAFLQLVGVGNGQIMPSKVSANQNANTPTKYSLPWWSLLVAVGITIPAFWLGSRHGRAVLIKKYSR